MQIRLAQLVKTTSAGYIGAMRISLVSHTEKKKESRNGSPRKAVWSSVTQLSLELHFGATLQGRAVSEQNKSDLAPPFFSKHEKNSSPLEKKSRFSKLLSKRAIFGSLFFSVQLLTCIVIIGFMEDQSLELNNS